MLNLIKIDEQKKWALVVDGPVPTIDQFKRRPNEYKAIPHGFYEATAVRKDVWEYHDGFRMRMEGGYSFKVQASHVQILDYIAAGFIQYNGSMVTVKGRFEKRGSEIMLIPGEE